MFVLWLATSWAAGLPLPAPTACGIWTGASTERGTEDEGQWAILAPPLAASGTRWRAEVVAPGAMVLDDHGLRAGLGAPHLSLAVLPAAPLGGGVRVTLPVGTTEVSQRAWSALGWVGSTVELGELRVGGQAGWTWAPTADPVVLPGPDASSLAHGAEERLGSGPRAAAPARHAHADPIHRDEIHGRVFVGPAAPSWAVAAVDVRHASAASSVELGVAWVASPQGAVRPSAQIGAPVWSTGGSGLHLRAGLEVRLGPAATVSGRGPRRSEG